ATPLIMDGEMIKDNLAEVDITEDWLLQELERQNYTDVKKVFYAEWMDNKKMYVLPYRKIKHKQYQKKQQKRNIKKQGFTKFGTCTVIDSKAFQAVKQLR